MSDDKKQHNHEDDKDMIKLIENLNRKDDVNLNRRAFLKASFGATVAIGLATTPFGIFTYLRDENGEVKRVEITDISDLAVGESRNFTYPTKDEPAILVRTPEDKFVAYNNKCTHLQCPVFYEHKENVLLCPCHKGYFNVDSGHPMAGPPQRELPKILLEIKDGKVFAVGREVRHEG